jgi:hypothetical protein
MFIRRLIAQAVIGEAAGSFRFSGFDRLTFHRFMITRGGVLSPLVI